MIIKNIQLHNTRNTVAPKNIIQNKDKNEKFIVTIYHNNSQQIIAVIRTFRARSKNISKDICLSK